MYTYGWYTGASLVAQRLKRLPAMQETRVWSLSQEDPLEKGIAIHSSILAWRIPETPGGLQSVGLQRVGHDWATNISLHFPFFPWWVWLMNYQLYFLKEPAFSFIDLWYYLLHFIYFYFSLYDFFPSTNFRGFFFRSSFSSCFRCRVRLFIWCFSCFLK